MNEDFSFVRFLKVVKTLYETSTFTQLGRTVGSALNPGGPASIKTVEINEGVDDARSQPSVKSELSSAHADSILDVITDACNSLCKDQNQSYYERGLGESYESMTGEDIAESRRARRGRRQRGR